MDMFWRESPAYGRGGTSESRIMSGVLIGAAHCFGVGWAVLHAFYEFFR
jgi:hypothetical protein